MDADPKSPSTSPWRFLSITRLILALGAISLYCFIRQDTLAMRSNPRATFMAALAASLARHGKAASTVDISWYPPNATVINDLSQVIGGSGVYGFIYNSSTTPPNEYGTYIWCNMPHVRATEYKRPSPEYQLQYVEVVSYSLRNKGPALIFHFSDPQTS